ncbi:MAG: hypothetical protein A2X13_01215 [Bacteroidetes bacterium GWC2_33_15]|nr:MAG: hypothetical protein A2X10_08410 [Bacteroidetes bacterium GWA2_33_15]OFX52106.1 MAG: hypothetical protein A2X13_01215 [Bacteroidetes bacterium GWC2_33_15]OFX64260.1 MAG: hypothetical protein A2X15_12035 [Bacteroidetes bacterium GWB2_32_14]OFX67665.1 MAG: hypothetical protein A2X14_05860 [Bacteroidetes bacterium GWD2_33_33]HAN19270.1 DUF3108 domain-containing protein [Bacteroidales bacterium]
MLKNTFILLLLVNSSLLFAQDNSSCGFKNNAFKSGETLNYVITYNWFLVWTDVGAITFEAKADKKFNKDVLLLRGIGISYPFYDWFFPVKDIYTSWAEPNTLLPVYYHRDVNEGGYIINIKYTFDYKNMCAYSESFKTRKPLWYDTIPVPKCTYDVVSVIYQARNIDFSKVKKDEKIKFKILLDNELHDVYIRYKGKEVKKVRGVGKFNCIKFTGSLIAGDIFKGGEDLTIWVTDDKNHIPVWIESPIIAGTVKARLVKYSGIKHPLSSLIDKY